MLAKCSRGSQASHQWQTSCACFYSDMCATALWLSLLIDRSTLTHTLVSYWRGLVLYSEFYLATDDSFPTQLPSSELELYIFYALVLCYLPSLVCGFSSAGFFHCIDTVLSYQLKKFNTGVRCMCVRVASIRPLLLLMSDHVWKKRFFFQVEFFNDTICLYHSVYITFPQTILEKRTLQPY